jgi:hypothetical protein
VKNNQYIGSTPPNTVYTPRVYVREAFATAIRHLAVEIGGKAAQQHRHALARYLARIERLLPVGVTMVGQFGSRSPKPWDRYTGLGAEVWLTQDNRILAILHVYSPGAMAYATTQSEMPVGIGFPRTVSILLRRATAAQALVLQSLQLEKMMSETNQVEQPIMTYADR